MRVPLYVRHHHNKIHILLVRHFLISNCEMNVIFRECASWVFVMQFHHYNVSNSNITVQSPMSFSYSRDSRPKPLPEDRLSLTCNLAAESINSSGPNTGQYLKLGYALFTSCASIRLHTICDSDNQSEYVRTYVYRGLLNILYLM
jgi:hypothetical protein